MSSEVERTLCQLPSVFVFKVPALRSAEGHRASDFPKDHTWSGKLKIVAKGRQAAIILMDAKNQVFAVCPVTEGSVEKTVDSGRYFILRIQNAQGKHAYIGIAFNERNDAFDFNVALQEHKRELEREDQANDWETAAATAATKDMSLKEGEKIKINIGGMGAGRREKKPVSGGGGFLPPPKERAPGTVAPAPTAAPAGSKTSTSGSTGHAFEPFESGPSAPVSGGASDPFAGSFGSSDPFSSAPAASSADPFALSGGDPFGAPATSGSSGGDSLLDF